jgi:hypothetical protein
MVAFPAAEHGRARSQQSAKCCVPKQRRQRFSFLSTAILPSIVGTAGQRVEECSADEQNKHERAEGVELGADVLNAGSEEAVALLSPREGCEGPLRVRVPEDPALKT